MNEKKYISDLVNSVTTQTNSDPETVRLFINQLFKEIERNLVENSHTNIEGLGVFRIIKSITSNRILFLGKLENDKIIRQEFPNNLLEEDNISIEQENSDSQKAEDIKNDVTPNLQSTIISEPLNHFSRNVNFGVEKNNDTSSNSNPNLLNDTIGDDDYEEEIQLIERREKRSKIYIGILITLIIIGILSLIYYFYPVEKEVEENNFPLPVSSYYDFKEIFNEDTLSYICIIQAESNLDFIMLSYQYYGSEAFWPYIYKANEDKYRNPYEIIEGSIIRIPRLDDEIINVENKESIEKVRLLGEEIIKSRNNNTIPEKNLVLE